MHVHLPKPLHGWREFLGEVGVIVLGVLIALGAEQVLQTIHERSEAADARENVRGEAALNLLFIRERIADQHCIDRRLSDLSAILEQAGNGTMARQPTWISRSTTSPFFSRRWEAANASGRNSLFPSAEQERFGRLYDIFARFNDYEAREQQVWSDLRALETWTGPLGAEARLAFAKDLQQAKYLSWDLNFAGRVAVQGAAGTLPLLQDKNNGPAPICLSIFTPANQALSQLHSSYGQP